MLLKVCGVVDAAELALLDRLGIDLAGVWAEVPGGARNVGLDQLADLVAQPTRRTTVVAVTLASGFDVLRPLIARSRLRVIQLHGFTPPGVVARLKDAFDRLQVLKVLHVQDRVCLEARWIDAYRSAGADGFILDRFDSRTAVGSTGRAIPDEAVHHWLACLHPMPVLLAGGIVAAAVRRWRDQPGLAGFDIDSGARGAGRLDAARIQALAAARDEPADFACLAPSTIDEAVPCPISA
jgi:phosphoribosylanthranilate isomerase